MDILIMYMGRVWLVQQVEQTQESIYQKINWQAVLFFPHITYLLSISFFKTIGEEFGMKEQLTERRML